MIECHHVSPQPWSVEDMGGDWFNIVDKYGSAVAEAIHTKAIADQLCAAPEMLAALKAILPRAINDGPGGCDGRKAGCPICQAIRDARAAIAKAEGRT